MLFKKIHLDSMTSRNIIMIIDLIFANITNLLFWFIAVKYYTPFDLGVVWVILSSISFINIVSSLGFPISLNIYLSKKPEISIKIINSCLYATILVSCILSFIFISGLDLWGQPLKYIFYDYRITTFFIVIAIVSSIYPILSSTFIVTGNSFYHRIFSISYAVMKIFFLFLFLDSGSLGIFLAWGTGTILSVAVGFSFLIFVFKGYSPIPTLDKAMIKSMIIFSFGYYLENILVNIPRIIFPFLIINLISAEFTGFFLIAFTISNLILVFPKIISTNFLLGLSLDFNRSAETFRKTLILNIVFFLPAILFLVIFFGKFALNLFGQEYAENALEALILLAFTSLPWSINQIFTTLLRFQRKNLKVIILNASIALVSIAFAIPLLIKLSINGIAFAYLIANTGVAIIVIYYMINQVRSESVLSKSIIGEIQKNLSLISEQTRKAGTPFETLSEEAGKWAIEISKDDYPKSEAKLYNILIKFCKLLPEDKKGYACELLKEMNEEKKLKIDNVNNLLTYFFLTLKSQHEKKGENIDISATALTISIALWTITYEILKAIKYPASLRESLIIFSVILISIVLLKKRR